MGSQGPPSDERTCVQSPTGTQPRTPGSSQMVPETQWALQGASKVPGRRRHPTALRAASLAHGFSEALTQVNPPWSRAAPTMAGWAWAGHAVGGRQRPWSSLNTKSSTGQPNLSAVSKAVFTTQQLWLTPLEPHCEIFILLTIADVITWPLGP